MMSGTTPNPEEFKDFFTVKAAAENLSEEIIPDTSAEESETREVRMVRLLSSYPLLYDIPFIYLVPSPKLLNENEIRFFYLDHNWIRALLDGMMSLGRSADIDRIHDRRFIRKVYNSAINNSTEIRENLQGRRRGRGRIKRRETEACTGFIMRSDLVRGWRGLEFQAYGLSDGKKSEQLLPALRIETLAENVLIGLYHGEISRIVISEPPEGLYHGLTASLEKKLTAPIRNLTNGEKIPESDASAPTRENRTVNIRELAQNIGKKLNIPYENIDSAHLALQLLRTARKLEISEISEIKEDK